MAKISVIGESNIELKLLSIVLKSQGHDVILHQGYDDAIEFLQEVKPQIAIIDVKDDYETPFELCYLIRQQNIFRHVPVIISCEDDIEITSLAFEAGATDCITKPFDENNIKSRIENRLHVIETHLKAQSKNESFINDMNQAVDSVDYPQLGTIFAMAKIAHSKDDNTGRHLERIQKYTFVLAKELQKNDKFKNILTDKFVSIITAASYLHDMGKIGIPDKILLKQDKLTEEEYEIVKTHTVLGEETILKIQDSYGDSDFIECAKKIARFHHERPDGTGYPDKLISDDIPVEAAIMAVADVYDAIRTRKVYKPAMSHESAIELIKEGKGSQFLPEVVDAFLKVEKTFSYIWLEYETMCN